MRFILGLASILLLALTACAAPKFDDYVQNDIRDFRLTATATKANQDELMKISKDFAMGYRLMKASATVQYKEPGKVRIEGTVGAIKMLLMQNGCKRLTAVPSFHVREVEDVTHSPGKRTTSLDFGFITPGLLQIANAKYIRRDSNGALVFDITWKDPNDSSRHRVWVNPDARIIEKREWYKQSGRMVGTFNYNSPVKVARDIYLPSKVDIYNVEGKLAGQTSQSNFEVNTDTPDSKFTW
jgi:hypothetical protein